MMRAVRQSGTARMVLVTGDRADIAETIGRIVGVDAVYPDRNPAEKLAIVHAEQKSAPTIMASTNPGHRRLCCRRRWGSLGAIKASARAATTHWATRRSTRLRSTG